MFNDPLLNVKRDTFEGEPAFVETPALIGDSSVDDSLKEFSISLVMAESVAGLGRILSLDGSGFSAPELLSVVVLVDIDTVRLLVVVVSEFCSASANLSIAGSFNFSASPMMA